MIMFVLILSLLVFWYSHREVFVRWQNVYSVKFIMSNGTQLGSALPSYLFACYIRGLISVINNSRIG